MARKAGVAAWLPVELGGDAASPLFQRLYRALRQAVLDGRLRPGARLPATRFLAEELGISRNTVLTAYDQLASEGFLELRHRSGVFVAEDLPEAPAPQPALGQTPRPLRLALRGREAVSTKRIGVAPIHKAPWPGCFVSGAPDVSQFPFDLWARLLARSWRRPDGSLPVESLAVGGDPGGHPELRAAIATYLGEARGIQCEPDHVLGGSGIRQAVDLTCRLLLDPGEQVWMENPGYPGIRAVLAANGAEVVGVPVDDEGMDVAAGRMVAGRARLVSVAPSHQFPL